MSSWIVFGGEDQRQHLMANRQQKRGPRTTTNIVVRNGTAATQARASGPAASNRRRRNRARRQAQVNVRVLPSQNQNRRRFPRRPGVGSRVVFQKITTTLGTVGSNGSEQIECEMTCLLNPATMKEATGSNAFGPLGIYASTYALFKMTKCELILKPLVGDSAVSGTVVRASWNPTATPSQTSWSSLGARKHVDITPGKRGRFTLTSRDLKGPKDGWYKTNTQGDPMMAFAGALEIHTIGKTMSTYQSKAFEGGLFLAELTTEWQFKDYQQQPGMLNLVKGEDKTDAKITTDDTGKMQLELPARSSRMARAAANTTNKTIWVVTDTIINMGANIFPPPFSWLIRGGWWIVKRAANAPVRDGKIRFDIYSSISDARSDSPCVSTQPNQSIPIGGLHFQQITPGNVGIGDELFMTARSIDAPVPSAAPTRCYVIGATMLKPDTKQVVPSSCIWYNKNGGQNHQQGVGFLSGETKVATFNVHKVTVVTDAGPIQPGMFVHRVPIKLFTQETWGIGYAVASSYQHIQDTPNLWVSNLLVYVEEGRDHPFREQWNTTKVRYPNDNYQADVNTPHNTSQYTVNVKMDRGGWYIIQFVVQGTIDGQYYVGTSVVASRATGRVTAINASWTFPPHADTMSGLFPAYLNGLQLTPFTTNVVSFSTRSVDRATNQAEDQDENSDLHPSFGCDDAFEFPPPPSEEDLADDEDEFEDLEEPEASNSFDSDLDDDRDLEMGPDDHYSDPPISRLVVRDDAFALYEQLRATHSERAARLAVNQLFPSDEYTEFTEVYHDALADGLSPKEARAQALGF
nr:MAG: capsid protein [Mamastrovirus 3]